MGSDQRMREDQSHTENVFKDLDSFITSAALIAALEHGLFWLLKEGSMTSTAIAGQLAFPHARCNYWLQVLAGEGYLAQSSEGYALTPKAEAGVLDAYSQDTWRWLAQERRETWPPFALFSSHIGLRGSLWEEIGSKPESYIERMRVDQVRATRFTRMLYELHQNLAGEIVHNVDFSEVKLLLDLGGGSGVISLALLDHFPGLRVVVLDLPYVCETGRALAEEVGLLERIEYLPADFLADEIPQGFDLILACDVGIYHRDLFSKLHAALNPGCRFVIIDQFAPADGIAPESRLTWAVQHTLVDPDFQYRTAEEISRELEACGFKKPRIRQLAHQVSSPDRFSNQMTIIESIA